MPPRNSREVYDELTAFQRSRRKPQDILAESESRLGIPTVTQRQAGLRAAITNTENLIRSVDPSVAGRTSGSLVTEAQKQRLVNLEREPLGEQFREQSRSLEGETANLADLNRRALQESQLAVSADDTRLNELQGLYSMLYQREQDEIARQERERAFAEAQKQARVAASGSGLRGLFGGGKPTAPTALPVADPIQQDAYNEVKTRIGTQSADELKSDFISTAESAKRGNQRDLYKLQIYRQERPELFGKAVYSWEATGGAKNIGKPAAVSGGKVKSKVFDPYRIRYGR